MDTSKKFLQVLLLACCCVFVIKNDAVEASHNVYPEFQSLAAVKVNQVHRTAFHFQPPSNWINGWYYFV
ncbi:beta-fructofuranosidase insoluble isoenzyme 1 [Prunus yedoensis var. nudiflora]|uniref:Beta-fructofuranosidase insoluble isoenzyme 1 n=1 Tax=Prunus yedoensis var. nudiflora TaxID=2094558 RepID=A0A314ZKY0_PRUYE|nr:beta-fructofuranosidase insoluble isoenzyme 1 [Prunus yedoensis var. nudiflora]